MSSFAAPVAVPSAEQLSAMSAPELEAVLEALDRGRRQYEAAIATVVQRVESAGGHQLDGHRSVRAWGKAACNWSSSEAHRFVRLGRMLACFGAAAQLAAAGRLGVAQMHALAQVVANPRVREHLAEGEPHLVGAATTLDFDDYVKFLAQWEAVADTDGAHDRHERAQRDRRARLAQVGERYFLEAQGGAAQGAQLQEIFDAFTQSEWFADWEAGVAQHGDAMCPGLLQRTPAQRRHDALVAIFMAAAGAGESTGAAFTVNLVAGVELFEHHLEKALGGQPAPLDPNDPAHRCETADGTPLDPYDLLVAAAMGHVRRVVLDAQGVVVDMGRKQRLFTGALREAVLLSGRRCFWPGCSLPASQCEADHVLPWANAGPSAASNGGPACGFHNRWKTRGYRTWRDPAGQWHHYRPDGSQIGWRGNSPAPAVSSCVGSVGTSG